MNGPARIEVRPAGTGDWRLMRRIQSSGRLFASDGFHPVGTPGVPGQIQWLVALAGRQPVGFCVWGSSLGVAEIRWMGTLGDDALAAGSALCEAVACLAGRESNRLTVTYPAGPGEADFWGRLGFVPNSSGSVAREDVGLIVAEKRLAWPGRPGLRSGSPHRERPAPLP